MHDNIGKAKYLKEAAKVLGGCTVAEIELYAPKIAEVVGVSRESVRAAVLSVLKSGNASGNAPFHKGGAEHSEAGDFKDAAPPDNKFTKAFAFVAASKLQKKEWASGDLEFELDYRDDDENLLGFEFLGNAATLSKEYADSVKTLLDRHLREKRDKLTQLGDLVQAQEITRRIKNVR